MIGDNNTKLLNFGYGLFVILDILGNCRKIHLMWLQLWSQNPWCLAEVAVAYNVFWVVMLRLLLSLFVICGKIKDSNRLQLWLELWLKLVVTTDLIALAWNLVAYLSLLHSPSKYVSCLSRFGVMVVNLDIIFLWCFDCFQWVSTIPCMAVKPGCSKINSSESLPLQIALTCFWNSFLMELLTNWVGLFKTMSWSPISWVINCSDFQRSNDELWLDSNG